MTSMPLHPTHAVVELQAFLHNLRVVRSLVAPQVKVLAVVKANAYGHGMIELARTAEANGAEFLGVARVVEGIQLREAGLNARILVFEAAPAEHVSVAMAMDLDLTVTSASQAERIASLAQHAGTRLRIHAKVDTGMGRLGMQWPSAVADIERIARMPGVMLEGVYSHFATSESPDQSFAREQLARFSVVLEGLDKKHVPAGLRHMANSGAIIGMPESHFDMVRPGIMLYGYPPRRGMVVYPPVQPVLSLVSSVVQMKRVPAGTSISYGRRYVTEHETWIATVPIGYGDGYSRLLTNKGEVLIRGKRYRIAGTVCMDACMVDLGPDTEVQERDPVTIIGREGIEEVTAWDLAEWVGTIPYEITCLLTARVPRQYKEA